MISLVTRVAHRLFSAQPGEVAYWDRKRAQVELTAIHRDVVSASGLRKSDTVLDLGAGDGRWSGALTALFANVVAVEPDSDARERAQRRFRDDGESPRRVVLLASSAENFSVADGSVDAVFCHHVFQYLNQQVALDEIARVLKPGGRVFLTSNGPGYFLLQVALGVKHNNPGRVEYGLKCLAGTVLSDMTGRRLIRQRYSSIRRTSRMIRVAGLRVLRAAPWEGYDLLPLNVMGANTHFAVLAEKPASPLPGGSG